MIVLGGGVLLFSAVMAAEIGVSAVWIGYMKRSVAAAVTASVILASLGCQLLQFSYLSAVAAGAGVLVLLVRRCWLYGTCMKKF